MYFNANYLGPYFSYLSLCNKPLKNVGVQNKNKFYDPVSWPLGYFALLCLTHREGCHDLHAWQCGAVCCPGTRSLHVAVCSSSGHPGWFQRSILSAECRFVDIIMPSLGS